MHKKLIPVSNDKRILLAEDKEIARAIKGKEPFFELSFKPKQETTDGLINIEISLRNCERTGFFKLSKNG